jgi:hypothetical protein
VSLGNAADYAVPGPPPAHINNSDSTGPVPSADNPVLVLGALTGNSFADSSPILPAQLDGALAGTRAGSSYLFDLEGAFDGEIFSGSLDALVGARHDQSPDVTSAQLSGRVTEQNGLGVQGVSLTLGGSDENGNVFQATATTDCDGRYTFTGIPPGRDYTLTESPPDGFSPTGATAGMVNGDTEGSVLTGSTGPAIGQISLDAGDSGSSYNFTGFTSTDAGE